ncbi:Gypsy retrotransposon integrase-like protein 1 [Exophiala dermatitidis]|nr:Gypsy retrotransposon integrase-like protein 1 [Exophiala dermatitidis]KAJ4666438.1 Gypsy retrotransposon integrase-like protein 1 [Exophiala dermatitidis]
MNVAFERFGAMGASHAILVETSTVVNCTYTSTRGQRMAGAPRTKILEDRLRRARALLSKIQSQNPSASLQAEVNSIFDSPPGSPSSSPDSPGRTDDSSGDRFENMLDGKARLTSTKNSTEYYGGGSGFAFLHQTQQLFNQDSPGTEGPSNRHVDVDAMSRLFDSPLPDKQALAIDVPFAKLLPSRQTAMRLLHVVFGQTYQLLQFLHEPSFKKQVDRIYDLDPMDFEDTDHDFLPLFYMVTALGYLFHQEMHHKYGCNGTLNQAMRHVIAARRMVNLDRCRDLLTLQTLLCFVLFLMSTARLASAHTFIGLAVAAAMRMGLHSRASCEGLCESEQDIRRRIFWTIVKLDIYSGTVLGLPGMINLDYVDQLKPSGLVRDYENEDKGGFASVTKRRMFAASAQYLDVLLITSKVVQKLYPKTDEEAHRVNGTSKMYVSNATVSEIEEDFKTWRKGLSNALGSSDQNSSLSSIVYELEMVHNFGHIILYRPFLHYLARTKSENPPELRLLRCATACIKISRFTISRSQDMLKQGFLAAAAWQSVYTVFLSLVTLIFFLATQHGNKEYAAILRDTECGVQILASTSCLDIGSRRCLDVLKVLTRRLAPMVDLDIDKIAREVKPLCRSLQSTPAGDRGRGWSPLDTDMEGAVFKLAQPPARTAAEASSPAEPSQQQDFVQRPQSTPQQVPAMNVHPTPMNMYPPAMSFPYPAAPMPMMGQGQSMNALSTSQSQSHGFAMFDVEPTPGLEGPAPFGQSDMEVPYTGEFAWPFEMTGGAAGNNKNTNARRGSQPQLGTHPLTQQDIAAFMRINPGDEPFL